MSETDSSYRSVADADEIPEGQGRPYQLDGHRIAVVRHRDALYAIDDVCPHADASLAFGLIKNGCLACPWHFAEFDLATGEVLSGPSPRGVRTYPVRERGGKVEVALPVSGE